MKTSNSPYGTSLKTPCCSTLHCHQEAKPPQQQVSCYLYTNSQYRDHFLFSLSDEHQMNMAAVSLISFIGSMV